MSLVTTQGSSILFQKGSVRGKSHAREYAEAGLEREDVRKS